MEREYHKKLRKNHHNILTCLDVALKSNDLNLMFKNVQRLNEMTTYLLRASDLLIGKNEVLECENRALTEENNKLIDEVFLSISEQKGRYQQAKKMLDEFYESAKKEYWINQK
jgi:hypothetical protein